MSFSFKRAFSPEKVAEAIVDSINFWMGIGIFHYFYLGPKFNDYESKIRKLNSRVNYLESKTRNIK
ncbi:putative ORfan [Saudi moumouvirus]|uniref:Uncharacterized protein n=1 Tax=Moumouvirus sp. 'Monve' TaxID=1128131 RepID=H2EFL7_9VIRU|nr:hypothetical protein mv_L1080 [Moumouvirus Monve]AQN67916.1 putative ORfan [Saudi moumouvirus]